MQETALDIKIVHGREGSRPILGSLVFAFRSQETPEMAPPKTMLKEAKQIAFIPLGVDSFKWFGWDGGCAYRIWVQAIGIDGIVEEEPATIATEILI